MQRPGQHMEGMAGEQGLLQHSVARRAGGGTARPPAEAGGHCRSDLNILRQRLLKLSMTISIAWPDYKVLLVKLKWHSSA